EELRPQLEVHQARGPQDSLRDDVVHDLVERVDPLARIKEALEEELVGRQLRLEGAEDEVPAAEDLLVPISPNFHQHGCLRSSMNFSQSWRLVPRAHARYAATMRVFLALTVVLALGGAKKEIGQPCAEASEGECELCQVRGAARRRWTR